MSSDAKSFGHTTRFILVMALPLVTAWIGWEISKQYTGKQLQQRVQHLEFLLSGQSASGALINDPEKDVDITVFWTVWRLLMQHYISPEKLEVQPMVHGAVKGMVEAVDDRYTVFMTPSQNKEFRDTLRGELQGIGAELTFRDGLIVIVSPLNGSPAEAAGLLPEDVIVEVDGVSTKGESLYERRGNMSARDASRRRTADCKKLSG